jgi:NhaA family Na+:H+ antiporter
VVRPLERFLQIEAASGILLLLSAAAALAWANSPWAATYSALWHTPVGLSLGALRFERSLEWLVNDGLMVIFFFVVGLEIRREMHHGELSDLKRAALPVAAAIGGMLVPACIYLAANPGPDTRHGWGVPMATDIAFAVGVLALLGSRVPAALRVLLLALAIIDDIGAILVIALFYSSGIALAGLGVAAPHVIDRRGQFQRGSARMGERFEH